MQPNISSYLFVFRYVFVLTGGDKSDKNLKMNKYEQLPLCVAWIFTVAAILKRFIFGED